VGGTHPGIHPARGAAGSGSGGTAAKSAIRAATGVRIGRAKSCGRSAALYCRPTVACAASGVAVPINKQTSATVARPLAAIIMMITRLDLFLAMFPVKHVGQIDMNSINTDK